MIKLKSVKFREFKTLIKKGELDKINVRELINLVNKIQDKLDKKSEQVCLSINERSDDIFTEDSVWSCLEELCFNNVNNNVKILKTILSENKDNKLVIWY